MSVAFVSTITLSWNISPQQVSIKCTVSSCNMKCQQKLWLPLECYLYWTNLRTFYSAPSQPVEGPCLMFVSTEFLTFCRGDFFINGRQNHPLGLLWIFFLNAILCKACFLKTFYTHEDFFCSFYLKDLFHNEKMNERVFRVKHSTIFLRQTKQSLSIAPSP